jgi:hypothetical protein
LPNRNTNELDHLLPPLFGGIFGPQSKGEIVRTIVFVALLIGSSPARAAEVSVLLSTPASITISASCRSGESCDQLAADQAQAHCAKAGRNAQLAAGGKAWKEHWPFSDRYEFQFNCIR